MSRLPTPGSDNGTWGDVLNDFLSVSLDDDGSLQDDAVGPGALADGSVTQAKIADGTLTDVQIDTANIDGTSSTPSLRTLGTGSTQAAAGDDARITGALQASNNLSEVAASASTSRTNLGLAAIAASGSAADLSGTKTHTFISDFDAEAVSAGAGTYALLATAGELINGQNGGNSSIVPVYNRRHIMSSDQTTSSGSCYFTYFVSPVNRTISNLGYPSATTTASSGLTICRFGLYTVDQATGDVTLVARTASDTTVFNTLNTEYTRALDATGGYPASYSLVAGTEYALSVTQVGTTTARLWCLSVTNAVITGGSGRREASLLSAQADLPTGTTTAVTLGNATAKVFYGFCKV